MTIKWNIGVYGYLDDEQLLLDGMKAYYKSNVFVARGKKDSAFSSSFSVFFLYNYLQRHCLLLMSGYIGIGFSLTFIGPGNCWWLPTNGLIRTCDNLNLPVTCAFYRLDRPPLLLTGPCSDMKR